MPETGRKWSNHQCSVISPYINVYNPPIAIIGGKIENCQNPTSLKILLTLQSDYWLETWLTTEHCMVLCFKSIRPRYFSGFCKNVIPLKFAGLKCSCQADENIISQHLCLEELQKINKLIVYPIANMLSWKAVETMATTFMWDHKLQSVIFSWDDNWSKLSLLNMKGGILVVGSARGLEPAKAQLVRSFSKESVKTIGAWMLLFWSMKIEPWCEHNSLLAHSLYVLKSLIGTVTYFHLTS